MAKKKLLADLSKTERQDLEAWLQRELAKFDARGFTDNCMCNDELPTECKLVHTLTKDQSYLRGLINMHAIFQNTLDGYEDGEGAEVVDMQLQLITEKLSSELERLRKTLGLAEQQKISVFRDWQLGVARD